LTIASVASERRLEVLGYADQQVCTGVPVSRFESRDYGMSQKVTSSLTQHEVVAYATSLSNWGRWGSADRLGTLNLITPQKRLEAARIVREGVTVSCAWNIEAGPDATAAPDEEGGPPQRFMIATGEGLPETPRLRGAREFIGFVFHGYAMTHVDALSHIFWDRQMYNGCPADAVTARAGATEHDVTSLAGGVVSRGILLDVARAQGREWLDPGESMLPEDLEAAENLAGVRVEVGDVMLVRSGYGRLRRTRGRQDVDTSGLPGLHPACLPWIHDRGAALLGSDTATDVLPPLFPEIRMPVHAIGVAAMGLWILDGCDLEELGEICERLQSWEFLFFLSPLRIRGATGSPVNPLAVF